MEGARMAAIRPTFVCAPRCVDKHSSTELAWEGGDGSSSHVGPSLLYQILQPTHQGSMYPLYVTNMFAVIIKQVFVANR